MSWVSIGTYNDPYDFKGTKFQGVFDGGGNEVKGLYISSSTFLGLFGYVGEKGVVKNVKVDGTVRGYWHLACVAGRNDGTVAYC